MTAHLRGEVEINCATEALAVLVLDWGRDPEWRGVLDVTVEPPGPAAPGQRIVERLRFAGLVFTTPTRITAAGRTGTRCGPSSRAAAGR